MKMQHRLPTLSLFVVITIFGLIHVPKSLCQNQTCGPAFRCGNINFTYPFWGGPDRPEYCGYPGFLVSCQSNNVPTISISQITYRILQPPNATAHTVRVARNDLLAADNCPTAAAVDATTVNFAILSFSNIQNLTLLYNCSTLPSPLPHTLTEFDCVGNGVRTSNNFFVQNSELGSIQNLSALTSCSRNITVPIDQDYPSQNLAASGGLTAALRSGFALGYEANNSLCQTCVRSNGRCGYNTTSGSFICYCSDRSYDLECNATSISVARHPTGANRRWKIGLSTGIAASMTVLLLCFLDKRYSWWEAMINWSKSGGENYQHAQEFMRNYGSMAPKLYTYSEVRKITNSFAEKLGAGGYGCVYRGKLSDGRQVAVKVLNDSQGNGEEEDFINEVAAISRTSHVNVVALLGFCYSRKNRALIYEFMPNGSLEKFIGNKGSSEVTRKDHLDWKLLYEITVGTARGLDYLHRGCNTRIVHFDIKPQNILLDQDFCPKISDFGLAKLCKRKQSILSTAGFRGTVGYIAPEMIFPSYGGVSHKSDVYSFGMMILEMVGLRRKLEIDSQQTSESYFPGWIYERVELGKDLPLEDVTNEEERETAMKLMLAGLWCIQVNPSDRPSISKVVEMMEGSLESLEIPPKPVLTPATVMSSDQASCTITTSSIS